MNKYKEAILNNKVTDFFLGRNEYFVLNKDYGGHDITSTYQEVLNFGIEEGEEKLFAQVDQDITMILISQNLTINDYTNLYGFIWFYFKYKFDYNKIDSAWHISSALKETLMAKYEELKTFNDMSNILRINSLVKSKYGFNILDL
jgi:hypothetical protein